jgi:hypothetical protein
MEALNPWRRAFFWKAQNPLPDAYSWENLVDNVGRRFRHSPSATGGAESALLAGEGEQLLFLTVVTTKPKESVGQNAAAQETLEFFGDMLREPLAFQFRQRFEGSIVRGDEGCRRKVLRS